LNKNRCCLILTKGQQHIKNPNFIGVPKGGFADEFNFRARNNPLLLESQERRGGVLESTNHRQLMRFELIERDFHDVKRQYLLIFALNKQGIFGNWEWAGIFLRHEGAVFPKDRNGRWLFLTQKF
jgi:hypothetical protein